LPLLGISRGWRTVNIVWCVAIAYSTMATKQHVAIDVAAGTVLALAAAWVTGLKAHAEMRAPEFRLKPVHA
ncbi:MAG: hypothetical protein JO218_19815, partial [Burkholderiales bacterium]|nr:hypothetical protein [Burkholderiales bacterium]